MSMEFEIYPPGPTSLDEIARGFSRPVTCKSSYVIATESSVSPPASDPRRCSVSSGTSSPLVLSRMCRDGLRRSIRRGSMECMSLRRWSSLSAPGTPPSRRDEALCSSAGRRGVYGREAELRYNSTSAPATPPSCRHRLPSVLSPDDPVLAKLKAEEFFLNRRTSWPSCEESSQRSSVRSLERSQCSFETACSPSPFDTADFNITPKRKSVEGWMFAGSSKQVDSDFDRGMLWLLVVAFVLTSIGILTSPDAHARQSRSIPLK